MFIKNHFFLVTLLPLVLLAILASFYRFYILNDYTITHEITCDPYTQQCFEWCEEEFCEEPDYYAYATRHATELYEICGADITECEEANVCSESEAYCEIEYCEVDSLECELLNEEDLPTDADIHPTELPDIESSI